MKPKPGSSSQTAEVVSAHTEHISVDTKILAFVLLIRNDPGDIILGGSARIFSGSLNGDLERPALNIDGNIPYGGVQANRRVKVRHRDEHQHPSLEILPVGAE